MDKNYYRCFVASGDWLRTVFSSAENYERKSVEGLSVFYFAVLAISYTFWSVYGSLQKDPVPIIPMTLGMLMSWAVVLQCGLYRPK